jgi:hypothetical protein
LFTFNSPSETLRLFSATEASAPSMSRCLTCAAVSVLLADSMRAIVPVTIGVAMDVPLR